MNLVNGEKNKFFSLPEDSENRYFIENKESEHAKIMTEHIAENSAVLDIACGQGYFGRYLRGKNCKIYGIDIDGKAIQCALKTGDYEWVETINITNYVWIDDEKIKEIQGKLDVIILADIIEHLSDPTALIVQCKKLLKRDGIILISVPNIAHINIELMLLNGIFNYEQMGILDNTHLKFFTRRSFKQWIELINSSYEDFNLIAEYIDETEYIDEYSKKIENKYPELYSILSRRKNTNALQIIFKLVPEGLASIRSEDEDADVIEILGGALQGQENIQSLLKKSTYGLDEKIKMLTKHVTEKNDYINELEKGIRWHFEKENDLQKSIEAKDSYIKELESGVAWQKEKIAQTEQVIEAKVRYKKELESGVEWQKEKIAQADQAIEAKDSYIKELESGVEWQKEKIAQADQAIEAKDNYIKELELEVTKACEKAKTVGVHAEELRKSIEDIENTRLWKIRKIFLKNKIRG